MKGGFIIKKLTIILAIIILLLTNNSSNKVVIPKQSIRFRVIANSNSKKDQEIKKQVVNNLNNNIKELLINNININISRDNIKNNIKTFDSIVNKTLKDNNIESNYTINYGMNYFPEKEYKGVVYKEGNYESLVIKLGEGLGNNFWCVLFPPLCLIETKETNNKKVEYKSYIKEIIDKYF